jgi:hypothetical protein
MKMNKQLLYQILVKYDSNELFKDFCDSLSKVIQDKYTDDDIIKIVSFTTKIDKEDVDSIDQNVGIYEVIF